MYWFRLKFHLKFISNGPINNIPTLVQKMAWRRSGDKPLSEPMIISFLIHICVNRPQWGWAEMAAIFSGGKSWQYNNPNTTYTYEIYLCACTESKGSCLQCINSVINSFFSWQFGCRQFWEYFYIFWWWCPGMNATGTCWWYVSIGQGSGLVAPGN